MGARSSVVGCVFGWRADGGWDGFIPNFIGVIGCSYPTIRRRLVLFGYQAQMLLSYRRMQIPFSIPAHMVQEQCCSPHATTQNNLSYTQPTNNYLHPGTTHLQTKHMLVYACVLVTMGLNLVTILYASLNRNQSRP
jgi:hypothetical protein